MMKRKSVSILMILILFSALAGVKDAKASNYDFYDMSTWQLVGKGNTGGFVYAVQANLWASGLKDTVGTVDGIFGTKTENAVKAFQQRYSLTADGIVGPQTWSKMKQFMSYRTDAAFGTYREMSYNQPLFYDVDYLKSSSGEVTGYLWETWNGNRTIIKSFRVW